MPPQSTPVSPPEYAAISTGSVRVALLVSTAENRKSFHANCSDRMLAGRHIPWLSAIQRHDPTIISNCRPSSHVRQEPAIV